MQDIKTEQLKLGLAGLERPNRRFAILCVALLIIPLLAVAGWKAAHAEKTASGFFGGGNLKGMNAETEEMNVIPWRKQLAHPETEFIPVIRKGDQKDRYVGRGWAPWGFFERGQAIKGKFDKEYARDKIRRFITKYGENAVRFNGWRTPWGEGGVSFHSYQEPYAKLSKELLTLLKEEGVTAIVSCSGSDKSSKYEGAGGVRDVISASAFNKVLNALVKEKGQKPEDAERHAYGSISAFAPWIPPVYDDLMFAVRKMRTISPKGTIAELFNERPAPWELNPFIEEDVRIMAEIFPSVAKAFDLDDDQQEPADFMKTAKEGYARMYKQFNRIWGERTIQGFVYLSPFIDPDAWGYSAHPYPDGAHQYNIRMNEKWMVRLKDWQGNFGLVDSICEIGVPNTIPNWKTGRDAKELGKWKLTTGPPDRHWQEGDKTKVLESAVDTSMDIIQFSTGKPPKVLIGWEGHNGRWSLDPRVWGRDSYQEMIKEWERRKGERWDIGYSNLYLDPDLWESWKMIIKDFWERGNPRSTVYLPDDAPDPDGVVSK